VFYVDRLLKAPKNPLPRQTNLDLPPLQVNNHAEYEVRQVLAVRRVQKKLKYYID
jgi:hypothetical protein